MMARKSFMSKLTDALFDKDEEEETAEDIDRKLAAEVAKIKKEKGRTVDGANVIMDDWASVGDQVYIMDMVPIYEAVNGRDSALGRRLGDVCENIFGRFVADGEGSVRVKGDLFIMSFVEPNKEAGFRTAAEIINEIGIQMMGERFKTIEIPGLLVVADKADIAGDAGGLDMTKAKAQVAAGGSGCRIGEPGPDDPVWLRLSKSAANNAADMVRSAKSPRSSMAGTGSAEGRRFEARRRKPGDADWVRERSDRRLKINMDPMMMDRRDGRKRRSN